MLGALMIRAADNLKDEIIRHWLSFLCRLLDFEPLLVIVGHQ
jgi:hypothetical protein